MALLPDQVFIEQMEGAVTRRGVTVEITSAPAEVARWGRYLGILAALAIQPAIAFVLAGVLTLVFSVLGGGRGAFGRYLALASHALVIPAVGTVLGVLLQLATGASITGSPFTPAAFLATEPEPLLLLALSRVDLFVVWMLVVAGVGVQLLEPRQTRASATALLLGGYLVLLVATAALAGALAPDIPSS